MRGRLLIALAGMICLGSGYDSPPMPNTGPPAPPPNVRIEQKLGQHVPLDLPFRDSHDHRVTLGECTGGKPTILVLAYYRCPMLCTEILNNLLTTLRAIPADVGSTFNVVVVSFDPREKPPLAAVKKANYLEQYGRAGAERSWRFLTGDPLAIATLADAVGFQYEYDPKTEQYAHASGIMIVSPDGTLTRYLLGVRFEARDVRLALAEASEGKVSSPADQVLLLCYHYDPNTGTYTFAVLRLIKLFSALTLLGIVTMITFLIWRSRRRRSAQSPSIQED